MPTNYALRRKKRTKHNTDSHLKIVILTAVIFSILQRRVKVMIPPFLCVFVCFCFVLFVFYLVQHLQVFVCQPGRTDRRWKIRYFGTKYVMHDIVSMGTGRNYGRVGRCHKIQGIAGFLVFHMEFDSTTVLLSELAPKMSLVVRKPVFGVSD